MLKMPQSTLGGHTNQASDAHRLAQSQWQYQAWMRYGKSLWQPPRGRKGAARSTYWNTAQSPLCDTNFISPQSQEGNVSIKDTRDCWSLPDHFTYVDIKKGYDHFPLAVWYMFGSIYLHPHPRLWSRALGSNWKNRTEDASCRRASSKEWLAPPSERGGRVIWEGLRVESLLLHVKRSQLRWFEQLTRMGMS